MGITIVSRLVDSLRISDHKKVVGNPHRVIVEGLEKEFGDVKKKNLEKSTKTYFLY